MGNNQSKKLRLSNEEANLCAKKNLLEVLFKLMSEKEFEKITVTELIKEAGVARATFYRNYSSKEEILQQLDRDMTERISIIRKREDIEKNRYNIYLEMLEMLKQNADICKLLLKVKYSPEFTFPTLITYIYNVKKGTKENYQQVMYIGAFRSLLRAWAENDFQESPEEVLNIMKSVFPYIFDTTGGTE